MATDLDAAFAALLDTKFILPIIGARYWYNPDRIAKAMPKFMPLSPGSTPQLEDEVIEWINENVKGRFSLVSTGDAMDTPMRRAIREINQTITDPVSHAEARVLASCLATEEDGDHIRFAEFNDFLHYRLRWT